MHPTLRQLAVAMAAVGNQTAGEAAKHLEGHQLDAIAAALIDLDGLSSVDMDRVLADFDHDIRVAERERWPRGGCDYARIVLTRACGPHRASEILDRIQPATEYDQNGIRADEIWHVIKKVAPFVCAAAAEHSAIAEGIVAEATVYVEGLQVRKVQTERSGTHEYRTPRCPHFDDNAMENQRRGYCANFTANEATKKMTCPHTAYWSASENRWETQWP